MADESTSDSDGIKVKRGLFIEFVYSIVGNHRLTQDTPILPEVWAQYACEPFDTKGNAARHDLILTPHFKANPAIVSEQLADFLTKNGAAGVMAQVQLSPLKTDIAARLTFAELIEFVLPLTRWWVQKIVKPPPVRAGTKPAPRTNLARIIGEMLKPDGGADFLATMRTSKDREQWQALFLVLLVSYARRGQTGAGEKINALLEKAARKSITKEDCAFLWPKGTDAKKWERRLRAIVKRTPDRASDGDNTIWGINLNRTFELATHVSRMTTKADAAERLFDIDTSGVTWAVIDSGIDARHPAFLDRTKAAPASTAKRKRKAVRTSVSAELSRVIRTYDFTLLRKLLAWGVDMASIKDDPQLGHVSEDQLASFDTLKKDAKNGRLLDWEALEPLLRIPHSDGGGKQNAPKYSPPLNEHGTHVAGIIGGDIKPDEVDGDSSFDLDAELQGLCPNIKLFDVRVCDDLGAGEEFIVIAAMQFISYLNRNRDLQIVHGVNISLSIDHEVANYACGQTPICLQAERLINDGVVVVAAAGNKGYQKTRTESGIVTNYADISITDPGNAQAVITVGSTHKQEPHAYGVSYFSSRGPTGDGRYKPDILAPGEKIVAPIPGGRLASMDGTSMAAPHVSAAAAMLIARHSELRARPQRVKEILCSSATDMGRDRYFQGAGMLDILRALQSV